MKGLLFVFLVFLPSIAWGVEYGVSCEQRDADVYVVLSYQTSFVSNITSNTSYAVLAPNVPYYQEYRISAHSNSDGYVSISSNADSLLVYGCIPATSEVWYNGLMGLAGILSAGLLFYSLQQAFLS